MSEEVGPYRLGALLGEGANAWVYAARDPRGREVALKLLKRTDDPVARARLEREADVLSELDHPGLVRVLDRGRDARGRAYLALERVDGPTLAARLEAEGPLPPRDAWGLVRAVALALRAAHAAGVLHRDLTPANVLLDPRGRPRLSDFGLARRTVGDPRLSQDGAGTGTPAYMAPEQWWGAAVDERTDVYGLGAVLFAALSGQPPWRGEPAEVVHRVATAEPPRLTEAPPSVADFVGRALAREPRHRPADVEAFVAEGDRAFGHRPRRFPVERVSIAALFVSLPLALGFGGRHDPRAWVHEAGAGGWAVLATALLVGALGARLGRGRPLAATLPLVLGALTFLTGMRVVMSNVGDAAPEARFALFHYGLAEASAGWFLGAAATAALFSLDATPGGEARAWASLRARLGIAACLTAALLAGQRGTWAVTAAAVALLARNVPGRRPDAALGSAYAVLAMGLLAWVRLESESARLFQAELTRAARAVAIAEHADAQRAVVAVTAIALLAVLGAADWRGLRTWPRSRAIVAASAGLGVLAVLLGPWVVSRLDRAALWAELGPRLALWNELDPPAGEGAGPARLGTTLQLGRRRIAVDGEDVAPIQALEGGRTGPLLVAERLGPRVEVGRAPELVLAADRALPFGTVARALGAAYELGVRRVDVLLVPGPAPRLDPSAPWEAAVVLPRELRAREVTLSGSPDALRPAPDAPFGQVVEALGRDAALFVPPP